MIVHPEPFDIRRGRDSFGNNETYFSVEHPHMGLTVTAVSNVDVRAIALHPKYPAWEDVVEELAQFDKEPNYAAAPFTFSTPRTAPFPEIEAYARESFTPGRCILEASRELTSRIHKEFAYDPRATNVSTPIKHVFENKRGVCQDFAHLQLACYRSLGLAARYISGYLRTYPPEGHVPLRGADASHAWISVYCGQGQWIDFDPTNDMIPSTDHITVAWGRDYNDVCPIRGVILGGGTHLMSVSVDVHAQEPEAAEDAN